MRSFSLAVIFVNVVFINTFWSLYKAPFPNTKSCEGLEFIQCYLFWHAQISSRYSNFSEQSWLVFLYNSTLMIKTNNLIDLSHLVSRYEQVWLHLELTRAQFKEQAENQNASIWLEMKKVYFNAQFYDVIIWDFQVNVAVVSTLKTNMAGFTIFDVKPNLKLSRANVRPQGKGSILLEKSHRAQTSTIPSLTKDKPFVHEIVNWLQSMAEGWQIQMSHKSSVVKIIEVHLILFWRFLGWRSD